MATIFDAARRFADGLSNVLAGVGGSGDKRAYDGYGATVPVTQQEVIDAYRSSWLVRKGHDLPPFDMTRAWRDWQTEKPNIEKLEEAERVMGVRPKVQRALVLARAFGGGALVMGGKGLGDPSQPLEPGSVKAEALAYINVLSRHQLTYTELEADPLKEFFGQPKFWQMNGSTTQQNVHPSRVIPLIGQPNLEGASIAGADAFWGDPLLQSVRDACINADLVQSSIASLVHEAKIDTLKIPGLTEMVSTAAGENRLIRRINTANSAKSILNTRVVDGDEEWDTRELSFTALVDIGNFYLAVASGAFDVPATRMLSKSPDGMNSTGKSDNDNYFMMIGARQSTDLRPAMDRLDAVFVPSVLGTKPKTLGWTYSPLDKPGQKETAETEKLEAETVQIYATSGLIPDSVMTKVTQNRMIESGQFPGMEDALAEAEAASDLPPIEEEPEPVDPALGSVDPVTGKPPVQPPKPTQTANDAAPRTLYVSRKVLNATAILSWAKAQGFETTLPAPDLHVTVAFSRAHVDWMLMGENWSSDQKGNLTIMAGGPRVVESLGSEGAVVLMFASDNLAWRNMAMREKGASWDFDSYTPHITITYEPGALDLDTIEPYRGEIVLGPEIFEEIEVSA